MCVKNLWCAGKYIHVSLTCYTGIACLQYQGACATALNKFAGLEVGRHGNEEAVYFIDTDERRKITKYLCGSLIGNKYVNLVESKLF